MLEISGNCENFHFSFHFSIRLPNKQRWVRGEHEPDVRRRPGDVGDAAVEAPVGYGVDPAGVQRQQAAEDGDHVELVHFVDAPRDHGLRRQ